MFFSRPFNLTFKKKQHTYVIFFFIEFIGLLFVSYAIKKKLSSMVVEANH